ncbi:MAG TPA: DMT family transporter [Azospirillaceae bacterium]|nr:DMT family transporter [Azospirillaceae bacterium]
MTSTATATHQSGNAARLAPPALLLGAVAIGLTPIFVRLSDLGPVAIGFWRILFSLPALGVWMALEAGGTRAPRRPAALRDRARLAAAGAFLALDLAVWHWSLTFTTVANATLLGNFAPVFVALASWILFGQRFTPLFLAGLALSIAGACVLMGGGFGLGSQHPLGDGLALVAAVFYAGYMVTVGRLRREFSTATIMLWSGVAAAAVLLPLTILSGEALLAPSLYGWAVVAALGLLCHAGGQSLIAYALAHLSAAYSSVALLLQPAIAAGLAWVLLAEPLGLWDALGAAVILAGIVLARLGSR